MGRDNPALFSIMKNDAVWIEVSLLVDGEIAEATAEVLGRYVSHGVVIESTEIADDPEGEGYPVGKLRVCGYLPVDENLDRNRRSIEEALWYLGRIRPMPSPVFKPIGEINWVESWKKHYRPVLIGERLVVLPAWIKNEDPALIEVRIEPGMAFGTGTHPTTQLCLLILEKYLGSSEQMIRPEISYPEMIDVGCGSGILSIAGIKLGVETVLGVDIDPQAIAAARKNAEVNHVSDHLDFEIGSVKDVHAGIFALKCAPLVVANILAPVLIRLLGDGLDDLLSPGGFLVLSGILEDQEAEVLRVLQEHGLDLVDRFQQEDWVALVSSKQDHLQE